MAKDTPDPNCPNFRVCIGCKLAKADDEFAINRARKDGLDARCRDCNRIKNQQNYSKHAKVRREYARDYAATHKAEKSSYNITYREAHKDELKAYAREWRKTHVVNRSPESVARYREKQKKKYVEDPIYREKIIAKSRDFRLANPIIIAARNKEWRLKNPDKRRAYISAWLKTPKGKALQKRLRERHKDRRATSYAVYRGRRTSAPGMFTNQHLYQLHKTQGHSCYYCECSFKTNKWTIDHFVPLARGGTNWPENIVLACRPCNFSKAHRLYPDEWVPRKNSSGASR
jgi:5-methylcytosine-specific restriction endonuclease McrA